MRNGAIKRRIFAVLAATMLLGSTLSVTGAQPAEAYACGFHSYSAYVAPTAARSSYLRWTFKITNCSWYRGMNRRVAISWGTDSPCYYVAPGQTITRQVTTSIFSAPTHLYAC